MFNRGSPQRLEGAGLVCQDLSLVAIGVRFEGSGIQDSFVIHQAIPFLLWKGKQFIGVRKPNNIVAINNLCLSWLEEGVLDFILDILTHDVIVELRVSFTVESEASDLAFHLSFIRSITIILGSSANEFLDVFIII